MPIQTMCILRTWLGVEGGGRRVQQPSKQAVKKCLHVASELASFSCFSCISCSNSSGDKIAFDRRYVLLIQGCQRQGLFTSICFPWWLAVMVSGHWFVATFQVLTLFKLYICPIMETWCHHSRLGRFTKQWNWVHIMWLDFLWCIMSLSFNTFFSKCGHNTVRFWANTFTLFKTQIPSMENMLQLFLDSLIQFQSVILNIIRIRLSVSAHFSLWGLLHLWSDSADPGLHSGEAVLHKTQCCLNLLMLWCWSWNWAGDLCFVLTLPRQGFTLQCLIDSE